MERGFGTVPVLRFDPVKQAVAADFDLSGFQGVKRTAVGKQGIKISFIRLHGIQYYVRDGSAEQFGTKQRMEHVITELHIRVMISVRASGRSAGRGSGGRTVFAVQ